MDIRPEIRDALVEIANVGVNRAAIQLSALMDDEIQATIPDIHIAELETARRLLGITEHTDVFCVRQRMQGHIDGTAMLLLKSDESRVLVNSLVGSTNSLPGVDMRSYEHEALCEIGNIIISSSTAVMADMLGGEIILGVPELVETRVDQLVAEHLSEEEKGTEDASQVILMRADLKAVQKDIHGSLMLMMAIKSLQDLIARIDEFLKVPAG